MTDRDAIVAAVLIEERFAHLYVSLGADAAAALAARPINEGGLGRQLHPATIKARARSYERKRAVRLEQQRDDERERLIAEAEYAVVDADRHVAALALRGDARGYSTALRAYEVAEATLERRRTEHVPLARWMRDSDEIDVALLLRAACKGEDAARFASLLHALRLTASLATKVARPTTGC